MITPIRRPAVSADTIAERVDQLKNILSRIVDEVNRQNEDFDRRLSKIEERSKAENG